MYWIFFVTCFFLASNSNNIVALCNRRPYVNKIPLIRRSADNAVGSEFPSLYSSNTTATALSFESNLIELEARRLNTLPLEVVQSFRNLADQLVPQVARSIYVAHIALLYPYIKVILAGVKMNYIPLFFIGPFLYAIPYATYWLWDNNIWEVSYIDTLFRRYVFWLTYDAKTSLKRDGDNLLAAAATEKNNEKAQILANLRLLSRMNHKKLCEEAIAVKAIIAGADSSAHISTSTINSVGQMYLHLAKSTSPSLVSPLKSSEYTYFSPDDNKENTWNNGDERNNEYTYEDMRDVRLEGVVKGVVNDTTVLFNDEDVLIELKRMREILLEKQNNIKNNGLKLYDIFLNFLGKF